MFIHIHVSVSTIAYKTQSLAGEDEEALCVEQKINNKTNLFSRNSVYKNPELFSC